eukprot:763066-Hanusia_phi.AAC.4
MKSSLVLDIRIPHRTLEDGTAPRTFAMSGRSCSTSSSPMTAAPSASAREEARGGRGRGRGRGRHRFALAGMARHGTSMLPTPESFVASDHARRTREAERMAGVRDDRLVTTRSNGKADVGAHRKRLVPALARWLHRARATRTE